jgi:prophage regulatory protein
MSISETARRARQRSTARSQPDRYSRLRRILRLPEVEHVTGKSRTSIYEDIEAGTFPPAIPLGPRAVGWLEDELADWQERQIAARGTKSAA